MKITKETKEMLEFCSQACINTYQEEYGKADYGIYDSYRSFDTGDVEFDIGLWKDFIVIAFEGSDGKADWKCNLNFDKVRLRSTHLGAKVLVHEGFENQYTSAYPAIHQELLDPRYIGYRKLLCTGHSLGGALATLAAIDVSVAFPGALVYCVTEGAPRVGNKAFVKAFNTYVYESYRIVYDMDTVSKLPPVWFGFRHTDKKIKVGNKSWWEYPLHPIMWLFGNPVDHYPNKYKMGISALKTLMEVKK